MMRITNDHNICLTNSFYWSVCSRCGSLWYPGVSMSARMWSYRRLKRAARGDPGKFLFLSKIMYVAEGTTLGRHRKKGSSFMVRS